jgi:biopolymer transport protein ExbB
MCPDSRQVFVFERKSVSPQVLASNSFFRVVCLVAVLLGPASTLAVRPACAQDAQTAAEPTTPSGQTRSQPGFLEIVFSGGIVGIVIMSCLIALSLTAAYLVFEQLLTLRRREILPEGLSDQVRSLVASRRIAEADALCRQQPSFLSFLLLHGLAEIEGGWSAVEKSLEDALAEQSARLFRRVEYLSVIGNIAPMLGLLGTVTGMILAFQTVASTEGSAGAADLAEGIYEALVTTVAGLVIAIPSLGAFAIFRNRVDEFAGEAAYLAQHVFAPLRQQMAGSAKAPPPPPPPEGVR